MTIHYSTTYYALIIFWYDIILFLVAVDRSLNEVLQIVLTLLTCLLLKIRYNYLVLAQDMASSCAAA